MLRSVPSSQPLSPDTARFNSLHQNPRDLVGKAKPVITAPTPAELHEIFLG